MFHEKENVFTIDYDKTGTVQGAKNFEKTLPTREADAVDISDVRLSHDGKNYCGCTKFWFAEGRVADESRYYDDDTDVNSLKEQIYPGVCQICPNSGHLMYIHENSRRWEYVSKKTQDLFVNWLTEQHLVAQENEGDSP